MFPVALEFIFRMSEGSYSAEKIGSPSARKYCGKFFIYLHPSKRMPGGRRMNPTVVNEFADWRVRVR
jgi:hypothetical protein